MPTHLIVGHEQPSCGMSMTAEDSLTFDMAYVTCPTCKDGTSVNITANMVLDRDFLLTLDQTLLTQIEQALTDEANTQARARGRRTVGEPVITYLLQLTQPTEPTLTALNGHTA